MDTLMDRWMADSKEARVIWDTTGYVPDKF